MRWTFAHVPVVVALACGRIVAPPVIAVVLGTIGERRRVNVRGA
jgi:hypothetical protein